MLDTIVPRLDCGLAPACRLTAAAPRGLLRATSQDITTALEPKGGGPGLRDEAAGFVLGQEEKASGAGEGSLTESGRKKGSLTGSVKRDDS